MTSNVAVFDLFDSEDTSDQNSFIPSNSKPRQEFMSDNSNDHKYNKEVNNGETFNLFKSFQSSDDLATNSFFNENQSTNNNGFQEFPSLHGMNKSTDSNPSFSQPDLTRYFDGNYEFDIGNNVTSQSNIEFNSEVESLDHSNEITDIPNDNTFINSSYSESDAISSQNEARASDLILNILNKLEKFEHNRKDSNNQQAPNKSVLEVRLEQSQLTIDNLNNKISQLEEKNKAVTLENQKLQDDISTITKDLITKDEYIQKLINEIQELNKTIENLQQNSNVEDIKSPTPSTPLTEETLIPVFPPSKPRTIKKNETKPIDINSESFVTSSIDEVKTLDNSLGADFENDNIFEPVSENEKEEEYSEDNFNIMDVVKEDTSSLFDENNSENSADKEVNTEVQVDQINEENDEINDTEKEIHEEYNGEESNLVELQVENTPEHEEDNSNEDQEEIDTTERTSLQEDINLSYNEEGTNESDETEDIQSSPTMDTPNKPIFIPYNPSSQPNQPLFISSPFGYSPQVSNDTNNNKSESDSKTLKKRTSRFANGTRGRRLAQPET